jgi:hypothetical protein
MVLSGITVPSGTTLDLSDLADDTHVSVLDIYKSIIHNANFIKRSFSRAKPPGPSKNGTAHYFKSAAQGLQSPGPAAPTLTATVLRGGTVWAIVV